MAELEILSAGGARPALATIIPAFEAAQGVKVRAAFGPAPELEARTKGGTGAFGLVIGPAALIGALAGEGKLVPGTEIALGGVQAAVALHGDAPVPDLSTTQAVRAAIAAAAAIVFNTASSGRYIDAMIRDLGLGPEVEPRIRRYETAEEAMRFLGSDAGRGAIGFGQSSAIRGYESLGVRLAACLPAEIGNVTPYEAALCRAAPEAGAARAFLRFLEGDEARAALRATGIE